MCILRDRCSSFLYTGKCKPQRVHGRGSGLGLVLRYRDRMLNAFCAGKIKRGVEKRYKAWRKARPRHVCVLPGVWGSGAVVSALQPRVIRLGRPPSQTAGQTASRARPPLWRRPWPRYRTRPSIHVWRWLANPARTHPLCFWQSWPERVAWSAATRGVEKWQALLRTYEPDCTEDFLIYLGHAGGRLGWRSLWRNGGVYQAIRLWVQAGKLDATQRQRARE